jgi:CheY-like chemotaxis protein
VSICVLVVEDEPTLRSLALDVLADAGFETLAAQDAAHALDVLDSEMDHIDVLFTDVRMPGRMNGLELAQVARRKWPELRVIVTSGYFERGELPAGANFLGKPWSASDLVSRIMQLAA